VTRPNPFAAAADRYAEGRPYHHARTLRRALAGRTPHLALDVACGTGLSTRGLAELGIAAVGVAPPPRGPLAADFPAIGGFVPERTDQWTDEVTMTRAALAAYLTTQSNVADEPPERIRDWFDAELAPFFAGGRGRRVVRFRGSCRLLRRGAGERGREAAPGAGAGACAGRGGG
jgi:hypothetical protein